MSREVAAELTDALGIIRVGVDITENGETYGSMELDLVPDENAVYSVVKCATQFAY